MQPLLALESVKHDFLLQLTCHLKYFSTLW